jgi:plasmid stabilization system protein ParE
VADLIVSLSDRATDDLRGIISYIADQSGDLRAQSIRERILKTLGTLAARPRIGRTTRAMEPGTRCFSTPPWIIFYDPDLTGIHVVRIVDGRRDLAALFSRNP